MTGIIYCAENNINGKSYIGQTIRTLEQRKNSHMKCKSNYYFHNALHKYDDWNWFVLQEYECEDIQQALNKAEIYYIEAFNSFKTGYNMTKGGGGVSGYKWKTKKLSWNKGNRGKISEETRQKMSEGTVGQKSWNKGKKFGPRSEETKKKISIALQGNKCALGHIMSIDAKKKVSDGLKKYFKQQKDIGRKGDQI